MKSFAIAKPRDYQQAATLLKDERFSLPVLKAGGIDLVDHLKEGLLAPDLLIDVKRLPAEANRPPVARDGDRIRIEASATLADLVESKVLASAAPVVPASVESAATPTT